MISASAVGYYPEEGTFDEYTNTRGSGFLAELCYAWEKEARRCPSQTRLVITRFGIVLSPDGGAMEQMLRPLRITRVAGVIGPGTQPFPWIAIQDLCRAMEFIIRHEEASGVFQPGGSATSFTVCIYSGNGSTLSCLDEGGRTALVLPDAIW